MVLGLFIEKFTIALDDGSELVANYNPSSLSMSYGADWKPKKKRQKNVEDSQFTNTSSTTLTVKLLFNTYNTSMDTIDVNNPTAALTNTEVDVTKAYTKKLVSLVRIDGSDHHPPICSIKWGSMSWGSDLAFKCVLKSLSIDYTMFLANGTPVRAEANCTFQQWRDPAVDQRSVDAKSPDVHKLHVVQRGETLSMISHKYYHSPSYWRFIAKANNIANPLKLKPGIRLTIPILEPEDR